jgi:hypothetical protein
MAKIFASGHLILPIPANPDHFRFFDGTLLVSGGMWLFQYPFGHPLLLAIGILLGIPNAIPPLVSTLTIFELVIIVSILYSRKTIFFLLPLPFISPFFIENSASFMSHTTAAFYLITSVLCIILALEKHKYSLFFISGVCIGLLFNTRPLTALPFFVCAVLLTYIKQKNTKERIPSLLSFLIGFGVLFLLWMVYNTYTTSSPFTSEYFEVNKSIFGFGQRVTLYQFINERLNNVLILAKNFFPVLYNLPQGITVLLLTGFLFFRRKISWDIIFFISLFLLPITYFFYNGVFLMYGPRFW